MLDSSLDMARVFELDKRKCSATLVEMDLKDTAGLLEKLTYFIHSNFWGNISHENGASGYVVRL